MANKLSDIAKKNVVVRWRKKKQLCLTCGMNIHDDECIENYDAADMRNIISEPKIIDENKKRETVIQYRKKKQLCLTCGKDIHDGECSENYDSSDLRSDDEKKIDPRIVPTPKIRIFNNEIKESRIQLEPTQEAKFNRDYIILDIRRNDDKNIDYLDVRYLSSRFSNSIVCLIGVIDESFSFLDATNINKMINVISIPNGISDQNVVNHICGCNYFIGHDTDFSRYAISRNIKTVIIKPDSDIRNIMSRIPKVISD